MPRKAAALILASALPVLAVRPARAVVLSEDPLAEKSTELGLILRSFLFSLFGTVLEPPINPLGDANPSATSILDLRLYASHKTPSWSFVIHDQLTTTLRSNGTLGPLGLGRGVAPPRWLPLRFTATDQPTLVMASTVDWGYVAYNHGGVTVTVGRQPVTFGRGKVWRPTDLVSTFALTEVDTEYKPGADAARVDWSRGNLSITAVAATGELESDHDLDASLQGTTALARATYGLSHGQVAATGGYVRGDAMAGADGAWDFESFDAYAEATVTMPTDRSLASPIAGSGDVVPRAVVGATFHHGDVTVSPELWWNGFGTFDRDQYLAIAASPRVGVGEQISLGRANVVGSLLWQAHPLLTVTGAAIVNPRDPSGLITVGLGYSVSNDVEASIGGYVPLGRKPDASSGLPVARSEYGSYPYFLFARLKAAI